MEKKKVLIDLTNLDNPMCGFGQIAINYADFFSKMKSGKLHFVFLVPPEYKGFYGDAVSYSIKTFWTKKFPFLLPKVDLWHSVNQQNKLLRLSLNTKYLLTIHDANFLIEKKPKKAARYKHRLQNKINRANAVTAISQYTADYIKKNFNLEDKKIQVILNGVEYIAEKETVKPEFVLGDRPFFFTIGQARRKKNFNKLVDFMDAFPEYDLYICGDTHYEYADEIRENIATKRLSNVFMPGTISEEEKNWLYQNCKAFFLPSQGEGFGLPVIEAMQYGKAVFVSNFTSLPEISGGHAFVWQNLERDSMIKVIKDNLENFYANEQNIENIKQYANTFSYDRHIKSYLELYEKLLFQ
ncbi:glycosyltransferase family 4 protein [Dysgonomonas reticulitermitis]